MSNHCIRSYQGQSPKLGKAVYVDPMATIIGDVELGDECSVWPMAVIRGDVNAIRIGAQTNIQDAAVLHVTHDGPYTPGGQALVLGRGVTVGHKALLHACSIGDYCLVGSGSLILDKAVLESRVLLGAGSLVPPGKILESGHLYFGNPVKKIRPLNPEELAELQYSAEHYSRLRSRYLGS